jgi:hypothetical protein
MYTKERHFKCGRPSIEASSEPSRRPPCPPLVRLPPFRPRPPRLEDRSCRDRSSPTGSTCKTDRSGLWPTPTSFLCTQMNLYVNLFFMLRTRTVQYKSSVVFLPLDWPHLHILLFPLGKRTCNHHRRPSFVSYNEGILAMRVWVEQVYFMYWTVGQTWEFTLPKTPATVC